MIKHRIVALNPEQRLTRLIARRIAAQREEARRIARQQATALRTTEQKDEFTLRRSQRLNQTPEQNLNLAGAVIIRRKQIGIDRIKQKIILRIFLKKQVSETHFI